MSKLPLFSAVIFDMDGLVLDTEATYSIAWQKAASNMGYEFSEDFCLSMSGLHSEAVKQKLIEYCGAHFKLTEFAALSGQYWHEYVKQRGIPVKKGFFAVLSLLRANKIKFCLATNSPRVNALECLRLASIEGVFSMVISIDEVNQGKPAPDIFLLAAEMIKIPITRCLVVEDSATGIQAAINAKAPSVFVPSVLPYDQVVAEQADYLVNDLDELTEIILGSYIDPV